MKLTRSIFIFALLMSFCLWLNGCIAIYSRRSINVSVHDAETDAPITGAKVILSYRWVMTFNVPGFSQAIMDQQGTARIDITTFEPQVWSVSKGGFIEYETWRTPPQDSKNPLAFRLYREPKPQLTLVIPNGFHGSIKIDRHQTGQWIQDEIGKRNFKFMASNDGYVRINASPLLLRMNLYEGITLQNEQGALIPTDFIGSQPNIIALRMNETLADHTLLVVGTAQDLDTIISQIYTPINGDPRHTRLNLQAYDALFDSNPVHAPPANTK